MTDRGPVAWSGKPLNELTDEELEDLAEWLDGEFPDSDPMVIAVRALRRERHAG